MNKRKTIVITRRSLFIIVFVMVVQLAVGVSYVAAESEAVSEVDITQTDESMEQTDENMEEAPTVSDKLVRIGLLFHDTRHQEAVPFVTLASEQGMIVRNHDNNRQLWQTAANEKMVFYADQFYLVVQKTTDYAQALTIKSHLQGLGYKPLIAEETLSKIKQFQVQLGHNSSFSQVNTLYDKIMAETNYSPVIEGYHRVQAGAYNSLETAQARVNALRDVGFAAYVSIAPAEGETLLYKVSVGNGTSEAEQLQIITQLEAAFVGEEFIKANNSRSLLIKKVVHDGLTINAGAFSDGGDKIYLTSIDNEIDVPVIQVIERFNRKYRGTIELTTHNSRLAVINLLTMDEYLYGVVPREMATGWPIEALKAQAVIARTFALGRNGWVIADVVDDVKDQAYWGYGIEAPDTSAAVDATRGQVLVMASGGLAQTFYSSNSGGTTAEGKEVWGTSIDYLRSVDSSYDAAILDRISSWYRVMLDDGTHGYVHSNYIEQLTETVAGGLFSRGKITGDKVNLRANADIYHTSIKQLSRDTQVTILEKVYENNAYVWSRGPFTAIDIRNMINVNQRSTNPVLQAAVTSLVVTQRGVSGRVMQVRANGQVIEVTSPDAHRSLFREGSSLRSTLFQIEARGEYTVLGANGAKATYPNADTEVDLRAIGLAAINGGSTTTQNLNGAAEHFVVINNNNQLRVASKRPEFVFNGQGFGHGFGLSQWGAYGMALAVDDAELPKYSYQDILHHYYSRDVSLIVMPLQ